MATFLDTFSDLKKKQDALKAEFTKARAEALAHVQSIVDSSNIQSTEINFIDSPKPVKKTRAPARIKYDFGNGLTWTGKGQMKREVKAFLTSKGEGDDDLPKYLVPELKAKLVKPTPKK